MNNLLFCAILIALLYYFFFYLPQQKKLSKFPIQPSPTVNKQTQTITKNEEPEKIVNCPGPILIEPEAKKASDEDQELAENIDNLLKEIKEFKKEI